VTASTADYNPDSATHRKVRVTLPNGVRPKLQVLQATATCDYGGRPPVIPTPKINPSSEWLDAWAGYELDLKSLGRSPHTVYARKCQVLILARHATAEGLSPEHVTKQWLRHYLLAQQAERIGNGYCTIYENLRQFWLWFAREYEVTCPIEGISRPKLKETQTPVLEPEQIAAILARCSARTYPAIRDRATVLVLLQSGMRRAELSALNWADLDMHEGTATVRHGKGDKFRVTTFSDDAHQALWRLLRAARKLGMAGPDDPVFLSVNTKPKRLTPDGIGWRITELGRRAGIPDVAPHQLRHSWAHYSLEAGIQEHDLMHLGGWTTTKQLGRYGKAKARERAIAAGKKFAVKAGL
jgi:integrase